MRAARAHVRVAGRLLLVLLCLAVSGYGVAYLALGEQMYPPNLAPSFLAHRISLWLHVGGGTLALALGPFMIPGPRARRRRHRALGKLYVGAVLVGGIGGLSLARFSAGGWTSHLGFAALGVAWVGATCAAWLRIRGGEVDAHRAWMMRSFGLTLAAVTLRLELPLAGMLGLPFETSYPVIAWMCWIPNLLVAEILVRRAGWRRSPAVAAISTA